MSQATPTSSASPATTTAQLLSVESNMAWITPSARAVTLPEIIPGIAVSPTADRVATAVDPARPSDQFLDRSAVIQQVHRARGYAFFFRALLPMMSSPFQFNQPRGRGVPWTPS